MKSSSDFEPNIFELEPSTRSLLVYPGEERQLTCRISNLDDNIRMEWLKNNAPILTTTSKRLQLNSSSDNQTKSLTITFHPVEWDDEGDWICYAEYKGANLRTSVHLMPISVNTEYCVQEWRADEKGELIWPVSKEGRIRVDCPNGPLHASAYRQCTQGRWSAVDSSECAIASTLTKQLLNALSHSNTNRSIDELLELFNNIPPVSTDTMSAFETRLIGWIIGNATYECSMLRSRLRSVKLNKFQNRTVKFRNLAICEHHRDKKQSELASYQNPTNEDKHQQQFGFISAYSNGQYNCQQQENVELLPSNGLTSIRIPWHTFAMLLPSQTVLKVIWLSNTSLFSSAYTADGKWVALNDVYGIMIKSQVKKNSDEQLLSRDNRSEVLALAAISFTFHIRNPSEQIELGIWQENEWKLAKRTECWLRRVAPHYVLIQCTRSLVTSILSRKTTITFFTVMQNAQLIDGQLVKWNYFWQTKKRQPAI
ncbi:unnamed protein product [Anisakis simplex]|uniref:Probable G-protein coupled receptor 123 (inferred by orthology to a human protein) n=1 Tax=Anisakis simplex TaxID=6269 RepID=A0A0M3JTR0_ANISI|nr:unnamed protein product [Anisakis simplex]